MYTAVILEDDISIAWDYEIILKEIDVKVACVIKNWPEALPAIRKAMPDIVIVDLVLNNDQKGFDFLKAIKNLFIPMIVCTGFPEQSNIDKALKLGVQAWLTKPVDKSAFVFHVKKALSLNKAGENSKQHMIITERGGLVKVPFDKIVKIVVEGNYSFIVMENNKRFVLKQSLSKTLERLDSNRFVRCHRSSIVNLDFVKGIDTKNHKIILTQGEAVDVGNRFRKEVKSIFKNS